MQALLLTLLAALLYAAASLYQGTRLARQARPDLRLLGTLGVLALLAHGGALAIQLLPGAGLRLDFFSASSLIAAAVILLTLGACVRIPVANLLVLLCPLGALTVLLAQFAPNGAAPLIDGHPGILAHILLSILAYGVLTIAMFQALLLALPLSGWLLNSVAGQPLPWFGLFQLPALTARNPDLRQVLDAAHVWLFWTLAALVALHLAAVLHHQLLRHDGLLRRMLPAARG